MTKADALEAVVNVLWLAVEKYESSNSGIVEDETVIALAKNIDPNVHYSYHEDSNSYTYYYEFSDGSEYTY